METAAWTANTMAVYVKLKKCTELAFPTYLPIMPARFEKRYCSILHYAQRVDQGRTLHIPEMQAGNSLLSSPGNPPTLRNVS